MRGYSLLIVLLIATVAAHAQTGPTDYCSFSSFVHGLAGDGEHLAHGLQTAPREAFRPYNLAWELPMGAGVGLLIAKYDVPAADRIQSTSLQQTADRWSNIGIGMELGSAGLAFAAGCAKHNSHLSTAGFKALDSAGAALLIDAGFKAAFNRQYPYGPHSEGEFWEGGKSFASGHSAMSFGFASAIAHEYPHNRWVKWGAYALATGVSFARYPAKKHFPSDIVVGAAIGYLTGTYLSTH